MSRQPREARGDKYSYELKTLINYVHKFVYPNLASVRKSNEVDLGGGNGTSGGQRNCGVKRKRRIKRDGATDTPHK